MSEAAISGERELSGAEKAAALLLMMGKPPAARLLKQFDQPDLRAVALAAAGLGAIPATMLDRLVEEYGHGQDRDPEAFGNWLVRHSAAFSLKLYGSRWGKRRRARLSPC